MRNDLKRLACTLALVGLLGAMAPIASADSPLPPGNTSASSFTLFGVALQILELIEFGNKDTGHNQTASFLLYAAASKGSTGAIGLFIANSVGDAIGATVNDTVAQNGLTAYEAVRSGFINTHALTIDGPPAQFPDQFGITDQFIPFSQAVQAGSGFSPVGTPIALTEEQNLYQAVSYLLFGDTTHNPNMIPFQSGNHEDFLTAMRILEILHLLKRGLLQVTNPALLAGGVPPLAPISLPTSGVQGGPTLTDSFDPNNIVSAPMGAPPQGWIPGNQTFTYTIHFENEAAATAAAGDIRVTAPLDPSLDPASLQPGTSSFNNTQFTFDPTTSLITWFLPMINLPPNQNPPAGEGSVSFSAQPKANLATGTMVQEAGMVFFDFNPPIATPTLLYTLDNSKPSSAVQALPATEPSDQFTVQWSGTDQGSGIRDFTLFASQDGGPAIVWLANTTQTSATYPGDFGHAYAFYSVARDIAGNVEDTPAQAEATTRTPTLIPGDLDGDGKVDPGDVVRAVQGILGIKLLTPAQQSSADLNGDGQVNIVDVILMIRRIVGLH